MKCIETMSRNLIPKFDENDMWGLETGLKR